jgi:hypothetical protein
MLALRCVGILQNLAIGLLEITVHTFILGIYFTDLLDGECEGPEELTEERDIHMHIRIEYFCCFPRTDNVSKTRQISYRENSTSLEITNLDVDRSTELK